MFEQCFTVISLSELFIKVVPLSIIDFVKEIVCYHNILVNFLPELLHSLFICVFTVHKTFSVLLAIFQHVYF